MRDIPQRTVLSTSGSSYDILFKTLTTFFDDFEGILETNTSEARENLENFVLDSDEKLIDLNV